MSAVSDREIRRAVLALAYEAIEKYFRGYNQTAQELAGSISLKIEDGRIANALGEG